MSLTDIIDKIWDDRQLSDSESEYLSRRLSSDRGRREFEKELTDKWHTFETDQPFDGRAILRNILERGASSTAASEATATGISRRRNILRPVLRTAAATAAAAALVWGLFRLVPRPDGVGNTIPLVSENVELIMPGGEKDILNATTATDDLQAQGFFIDHDGADGVGTTLRYMAQADVAADPQSAVTLKVPRGSVYTMELPDGTAVYLNSQSTLRFAKGFAGGAREVYLSGEAGFAVKNDGGSEFKVHAAGRTVVVTGTRFNVSAYDDEVSMQTLLIDGGVRIDGGLQSVEMSPDQLYTFDRATGRGEVTAVDPLEAAFAPWSAGTMNFKSLAFEDVVRKLERWYDFTITYEDESIRRRRFTGTISRDEPLEVFLNFLEQTTDIDFEVRHNEITARKRE